MKQLFFSCLVTMVLATACATAPLPEHLSGLPLLFLAKVDSQGLFSGNLDGTKIAITKDGLSLLETHSRSIQKLSERKPIALAWSPDGLLLAAAFTNDDYETGILIYSADGTLLKKDLLTVALSQLAWSSRGDLLAAGFVLNVYSFGSNLRQLLYKIDLDSVEEILLADNTLRPSLARQVKPVLSSFLPVSFSPQGDELVFFRLHDPPAFSAYCQLVYQNWQVPGLRELGKFPLEPRSVNWDVSGTSITIQNETGQQAVSLWPAEERAPEPIHSEEYRFTNGRLYRGLEPLNDRGEGAQMQLLADGLFLLAIKGRLYLGEGLENLPAPSYNAKDWNLRRWRYEELITPDEYQKLRQEIVQ